MEDLPNPPSRSLVYDAKELENFSEIIKYVTDQLNELIEAIEDTDDNSQKICL